MMTSGQDQQRRRIETTTIFPACELQIVNRDGFYSLYLGWEKTQQLEDNDRARARELSKQHELMMITYVKKVFVQTNHTYCSPSIGSFYLFYIPTGRALKASSFYVHYIIKCIFFL